MGVRLPGIPGSGGGVGTDVDVLIANHNADTTSVHGFADTSAIPTETEMTAAIEAAVNDIEVSVTGETYINADGPAYDGDIQAAIDAHTAGCIYIPGASSPRVLTETLNVPDKISLIGDGPDASVLDAASSLGDGIYAVNAYPDGDGTYHNNTITGIGLHGPAHGTSLTPGTAATVMHGLKLGRRTVVDRCFVSGFNIGVAYGADHIWMRHSTANGNHYNVAWISSASRWGDHGIMSCNLDGASMASVAVLEGSFIDSCLFQETHMGAAPYGIYAPPGRSETRFINNSIFVDVAVELFGNSAVSGQTSTDSLTNLQWLGGSGLSQSNTYRISATTYEYVIQSGTFSNCLFDNHQIFPSSQPSLAWFYSLGSSIAFVSVRVPAAFTGVAAGKPILLLANGGAATLCRWKSAEASGRFMRSASALTAGQHAKVTGRDACDLYGTADGANYVASAGVAKHACSANENVALVTGGYAGAIAIAGGSVTAGRYVMPDAATAGRLINSDFSSAQTVGVAMTSQASAGSTFQIEMRSGSWV